MEATTKLYSTITYQHSISPATLCLLKECRNLWRGSLWLEVYLGIPHYTRVTLCPLSSWSLALPLTGLRGVAPLVALDPSPNVDAKEVPRMNEFLALTPCGGLATPTREATHRETRQVTGKPPASAHLHQRGPYLTIVRTGFHPFPA